MITRRFPVLFARQSLRALVRRPVLLALNIFSVALGVAVFLAIQIANRSANQSFRAGIEMVAGRAHLEIRGDFDDALFPAVAATPGVRSATPVLEAVLPLPDLRGEYLRLVGIDPFTGADLRTFELLGIDRGRFDLEAWLREPHAVAVSRELFPALGLPDGSPLRVRVNGRMQDLRPAFFVSPADTVAGADPRIVAMDIGWAQELLGKPGRFTAILLTLEDPRAADAVAARLAALLPGDVTIGPPARRGRQVESMLGAFHLNLTALSLVSVLVGMFLIYNAVSASVVRRQPEIGILRAIGASRAEIRLLFLGEALVAGCVGVALGILLALPLASFLAAPLAQTISSLYILVSIDSLRLSPLQLAEAVAVGLGATLLAAWIPAAEAARCDPARVLHPGSAQDRFARVPKRWLILGLAFLALAWLSSHAALARNSTALGFAAAFFVLAGFSLLVPASIRLASIPIRLAPALVRLAAQNLSRSVHRNSVTIAALAAAIAMTVGISVMIHSFRQSVNDWINATLVADLFIGSAANELRDVQAMLPDNSIEWLNEQAAVASLATFTEVPTGFRDEQVSLAVVDERDPAESRFLGAGSRAEKFRKFTSPGFLAVSEPFANRFGIAEGDRLTLRGPEGPVSFEVAGITQDYARSKGVILIHRPNYEAVWPPLGVMSVSIHLAPGADPETLARRFRDRFGADGRFSIYSNDSLRVRIFEIFDQTFAVTFVLRAISIFVAAVGVLLSLLILAAEREREVGVLRAIGASRIQVGCLFLGEAALIGLLASLVGLASGACLSMVLTWVVNKASFGWTIALSYPLDTLLLIPAWIIPVAVAAALLPAWRAAQIPPAAALRFE